MIKNCAFCVHWDHHPHPKDTPNYGAGTDEEEIREYIRIVKPDMMQYHALGCYGYASFPSKIALPVPGLVGDPLAIWSRICREEGVKFGIYVASYGAGSPLEVPRWREIGKDGKVKPTYYCYNGPWTDEFLISLLLELIDRYSPNHFWLDGVWLGREPCHCEHCKRKFKERYGYPLPKEPVKAHWMDIQEMREASIDEAIKHVAEAIKKKFPNIQIACNSAYFFKDLRKPVDVDWLSWDCLNTPDWRRASFESTYLSTAGKPADIMVYENAIISWGKDQIEMRPRSLPHLKTEASTILAHGIRFHYWQDPNPDGSLEPDKKVIAAGIGEFVRQRSSWCVGNESVAEVAILASRKQHLAYAEQLDLRVRAMHQILKEGHIPCDVVRDDTLAERIDGYRLMILPETDVIYPKTAEDLKSFAELGGSILIIGKPAEELQDLIGGAVNEVGEEGTSMSIDGRPRSSSEHTMRAPTCKRYEVAADLRVVLPVGEGYGPLLLENTFDKGRVFFLPLDVLSEYAVAAWSAARDQVLAAVRKALGDTLQLEVEASAGVEVVMNKRDNELYVHFVNHVPGRVMHEIKERFLDDVAVIYGIRAKIQLKRRPESVILMPGEETLQYSYKDEYIYVELPPLEYHMAVKLTT